MALDSCARVIARFVRPALGPTLVSALGVKTERASGTDVSAPAAVAEGISTCGAVVTGTGGAGGALGQAVNASANTSTAAPGKRFAKLGRKLNNRFLFNQGWDM